MCVHNNPVYVRKTPESGSFYTTIQPLTYGLSMMSWYVYLSCTYYVKNMIIMREELKYLTVIQMKVRELIAKGRN